MEKPGLKPASEVLPSERPEPAEPLSSGELAVHMMNANEMMRDINRFTDQDFDKIFRRFSIEEQMRFKELVDRAIPSEIRAEE